MEEKKTIAIAGGSGLIGQALAKALTERGHQVRIITRKQNVQPPFYHWNPATKEIDAEALKHVQVLINLSGEGIVDKKWSENRQKEIVESRVFSTWFLYELSENMPALTQFISASAISCYGFDEPEKFYCEEDKYGNDYLSQVIREWEKAADLFATHQKVVKLRTGIVLTEKGGALPKISGTVKKLIGAPLGTGRQIMAWITLKDMVNMYIHCIENQLEGTYNAIAGNISNAQLTNAIGKELHKPLWLPKVPSFALKLALGERADLVLKGVNINNDKIKNTGFEFQHPTIETAMQYIYQNEK